MKKVLFLVLFVCVAGVSFGQDVNKLAKVQAEMTKVIKGTQFQAMVDEQFPGVKVYPLSIGEELPDFNMFFLTSTGKINITPEYLASGNIRCIAAGYVHEVQHMADFKKLTSFGIVTPPRTIDYEIGPHSVQYAFMVEKMQKHGKDYYKDCPGDASPQMADFIRQGGYNEFVARLAKVYEKNVAMSFSVENIREALKQLKTFEQKSATIAKIRGASYLQTRTLPTAEQFFTSKEGFCWWYAISNESLNEILQGKNEKYNKYSKYTQEQLVAAKKRIEEARQKHIKLFTTTALNAPDEFENFKNDNWGSLQPFRPQFT